MTFPQPSSTAPLLDGQEYFRLKTDITSSGDLYESEVSGLGFALGPDSDLAHVRVSYFDDEDESGVGQFFLSPDRNFAGRVGARPAVSYIKSATRKGRILIGTDDLYSPGWTPVDAAVEIYNIIPPVLDVVTYFQGLPSVIPPRSDKTYRAAYFEHVGAGKKSCLGIPMYGRKSGVVQVLNKTTIGCDFSVTAVRFIYQKNPLVAGGFYGVETTLGANATLANDAARVVEFSALTQGLWDYLVLKIGGPGGSYNGGDFPVVVTLSDDF